MWALHASLHVLCLLTALAAGASLAGSTLLQLLPPNLRPNPTDITAAVRWAAVGGFGAMFFVQVCGFGCACNWALHGLAASMLLDQILTLSGGLQPFDWIKAQVNAAMLCIPSLGSAFAVQRRCWLTLFVLLADVRTSSRTG